MTTTLNVIQAAVVADQNGTKTLEQAIFEAVEEARAVCDTNGSNSPDCAVAWDIVEELQAEKSHRKQAQKTPTSLDYYCYEHPEAVECRLYDV